LSPQRLIFGYDKTYIISRLNFNLQCRSAWGRLLEVFGTIVWR
jgi:hypothetical protein